MGHIQAQHHGRLVTVLRGLWHAHSGVHLRCPICNGRKRHLEIIPELCKGCGKCAKNCPMDAISGQIRMPHVIDTTKCIHCGACWGACPFGAIDAIEEEV